MTQTELLSLIQAGYTKQDISNMFSDQPQAQSQPQMYTTHPQTPQQTSTPQAQPQMHIPQVQPQMYTPQAQPQMYTPQTPPQMYTPQAQPQMYIPQAQPQTYTPQAQPQMNTPQAPPQTYTPQEQPMSVSPELYISNIAQAVNRYNASFDLPPQRTAEQILMERYSENPLTNQGGDNIGNKNTDTSGQ